MPLLKVKLAPKTKAKGKAKQVVGKPQPQSGDSSMPALSVGDKAELIGLQAAAELNGIQCSLLHFDEGRGRWQVHVDHGHGMRHVKEENLLLLRVNDAASEAAVQAVPAAAQGRKRAAPVAAVEATEKPAKKARGIAEGTADVESEAKAKAEAEAGGGAGGSSSSSGRKAVAAKPSAAKAAPKAAAATATKAVGRKVQAVARGKTKLTADEGPARQASSGLSVPLGKTAKSTKGAKAVASAAAAVSASDSNQPNSKKVPTPVRIRTKQAPSGVRCLVRSTPKAEDEDETTAEGSENIAMLLRRMVMTAEFEQSGCTPEEAKAKAVASPVKMRSSDLAAELKAAGKDRDDNVSDLDGERGISVGKKGATSKRPTGTGTGTGTTGSKSQHAGAMDGEDNDDLFDAAQELEAEEVVSVSDNEGANPDEDGDDSDIDFADFEWEPVGALEMPKVWPNPAKLCPGEDGFNALAAECLEKARLGTPESPFIGLGLRLHQESASFLVHPQSPVSRLLVDHATGTGKTLIILRILENYFDDPRPKIAVFPKERVCDNFYKELLKWPTRWRSFFAHMRPLEASLAAGVKDWRRKRNDVWDLNNDRIAFEAKGRSMRLERVVQELVACIREVLEMKNSLRHGKVKTSYLSRLSQEHPKVPIPRAPLRAFRYTTAGGGAAELGQDNWPKHPILKVGYSPEEMNPYSRKVVIMDECHNLVRPCPAYEEQLGHLREMLFSACDLVLAGFTGTPVGNDPLEGRYLLDIIKGKEASESNDEGFVSSFHARASSDFCREEPVTGIPDGVIHEGMVEDLVKRYSMHGEALKRYLLKEVEFQIVPRLLRLPKEKKLARLANYCNMHVHYGAFHSSNKAALLADVKGHAPKFFSIAKSIAKEEDKCVVMLSRDMGFKTMFEVLRRTAKDNGFRIATMDELSDFNDAKRNLRGEKFRVLLADPLQAGEGVQFRHVRKVHLVDVPQRHSDLVQRCSRCVRLGGHAELPPEERTLTISLHVAQLPKFLRQGPGSLIYRELLNAKDALSIAGSCFEDATEACLKELRKLEVETLPQLQAKLQEKDGENLIELLTETALEQLGNTNNAPARPLAMALWRLRKGGDDVEHLEQALLRQGQSTADDQLLEALFEKSSELLPSLEDMRMNAVDRSLLATLGDPPKAPPPRSEASRMRAERAKALLLHAAIKKDKKKDKKEAKLARKEKETKD